MAFFTALAAIAAGAAVVGTVKSIKAQKKASKAQQQQNTVARRRSVRQNVREMQIQRAKMLVSAQGSGSLESSGAAAGTGGLVSNLGGALGYSSQQSALSGIITRQNQRAATWSGVAGLGSQVFNAVGGFNAFGGKGAETPDLTQ